MFRNPGDLPPSKTPEERQKIIQMGSKYNSEIKNPCLREQNMSYKCMSDNDYDRDMCLTVFQNYKNCREFWNKVERDRRRKGISPTLPCPEDRGEVKKAYLKEWGMK